MKEEKMTPIEYLKQYLGVTDGELFDVYDEYGDCIKDCPYHFSGNKIVNERNLVDCDLVYDLMACDYTIKKNAHSCQRKVNITFSFQTKVIFMKQ